MEQNSRAYEQYCWVVGHNVVMEELTKDSRKRVLRCTNEHDCKENGGCKNRIFSDG